MYVSRIGSRLRVQIHEFSGKLSPRFSKPAGRFVEQMLYGILVSKDVKLSQIGRALEEPITLKKTEDRLSTNLNSDGLAGELQDQIACQGSRRVQKCTVSRQMGQNGHRICGVFCLFCRCG